ncbi:desumoylating isopeptidase 1-like [Daktulosphaira vitifoliae]|uniref:desumoylating isopeptidase 1-like n=1 Tax=Daktulosphaira vitifoliae TaxID=58002 RepID=UPI0021AA0942|nr:desumoylating isopeptidase 1-like [Daktulosphaira vitifoliae]
MNTIQNTKIFSIFICAVICCIHFVVSHNRPFEKEEIEVARQIYNMHNIKNEEPELCDNLPSIFKKPGKDGEEVFLYVYDMSRGLSQYISKILKIPVEGIWHSSIVVYDKEHFYNSCGVFSCKPKTWRIYGEPTRINMLCKTMLNEGQILEIVNKMKFKNFSFQQYNLMKHNCNIFANELSIAICKTSLPSYILDLPKNISKTHIGPVIQFLSDTFGKNTKATNDNYYDYEKLTEDISNDSTLGQALEPFMDYLK